MIFMQIQAFRAKAHPPGVSGFLQFLSKILSLWNSGSPYPHLLQVLNAASLKKPFVEIILHVNG